MASVRWEPGSVKAQLRLTSQRLGQLQGKKDSQGNITRRDIATLLQQGNIGLARAKAQNLIQEDASGDLLEVLEMHVGLILEHFNELDQNVSPSPVVVEAASSIIFAAPQSESKDLNIVRDLLVQRLGPDFYRSAVGNRDNHVSSQVIRAVSAPPPSAENLNTYLLNIAKTYGVKWAPERRRQDILNPLSEILDPEMSLVVDLPRLRKLCSHGIPDEPAWLRPRVWKLFFGLLPVAKASWNSEINKLRESYYDLIRRILEPFSGLPLPETPLSPLDSSLLSVSKRLSSVPPSLFSGLEDAPEFSTLCPTDDIASDDIKIDCASNLDFRLKVIQDRNVERSMDPITPEIRLESDGDETSEISHTPPKSLSHRQNAPTTLVPSRVYHAGNANQKHSSALLRLLYLHSSINPGNHSPHLPSLLVPLYSVLTQEIEPQDSAHAEADTFWLFEAMVGEFSELEDEEEGNIWMKRFSERLVWADGDLWACLHAKGLDPALPHYSYRWLASLLTQTMPLSSVILVWDALFSCDMRERATNPKLDYLLDICTGMLIRARKALFRLGKSSQRAPGLWVEENDGIPPPLSLRVWEHGDAFLEGMTLLQLYPVEAAGGIDRLLQTASDLAQRRQEEAKTQTADNLSLGARLKSTMWKGFTNQTSSPENSPMEEETPSDIDHLPDDGNDTETPQNASSSGLTSRLATTVWRGITNQTSMEAPPSPLTPLSPVISRSPSPLSSAKSHEDSNPQSGPSLQAPSSIWSYAEKLKDSDTAAALAKASSNWRARALLGTWNVRGRPPNLSPPSSDSPSREKPAASRNGTISVGPGLKFGEARGDSPSGINRTGLYSPPQRPTYFHPPRDSIVITPENDPIVESASSSDMSPQFDSSLLNKTKNLQASLASLTRSQTPQPASKSGPRPLLLSSSSLITATQGHIPSSRPTTPTPELGQWNDVMRTKAHNIHRGSQSSVSSLSPSDALSRPLKSRGSDWDSDTGGSSRVIPLNRRSVSPMAPSFRLPPIHRRPNSAESSSSDRGLLSPPMVSRYSAGDGKAQNLNTPDSQGWGRIDMPDSPPIASPPPPHTPITIPSHNSSVRITDSEQQRGSVVLSDPNGSPLEPPPQSRKLIRKKTPPPTQYQTGDTSDSSVVQAPPRSPRVRSKHQPPRPAHLRIQEHSRSRPVMEQKIPNPNSLAVEWPVEDVVITPRAASFDVEASPISTRSPRRTRKVSTDGPEQAKKLLTDAHDVRVRKISTGSRTRKVSTENKEVARRSRDSAAEEGDDEGYDDLLSAYESEEGSRMSSTFR